MPQDNNSPYRYTQVPSPLVQPGGILNPHHTVVIGEENVEQPHTHVKGKANHPEAKVPTKAQAKAQAQAGAPKKGGCIPQVLVVLIVICAMFGACAGMREGIVEGFDDVRDEIEQTFDDVFDDEHVLCDDEYINNFAERNGLGELYLAFSDINGTMYYYAPESDMYASETKKLYIHFEDDIDSSNRMPEADTVYDEEYCEHADEYSRIRMKDL